MIQQHLYVVYTWLKLEKGKEKQAYSLTKRHGYSRIGPYLNC